MAIERQNRSKIHRQEQYMMNWSFDEALRVLVNLNLGYDGQNVTYNLSQTPQVKKQTSGADTYVGLAAPGTTEETAKWLAIKWDGSRLTYADGNANFDNTATDLTELTYS